jgi:hypothetical protein
MDRPRIPHKVLPGRRIPNEEFGGEQRAFALIAGMTRCHEVTRVMGTTTGQRNYVIQCGVFQSQAGTAVDTAASTIPEGRTLDLALVLLVQHSASVAG